eukprot:TRINITY_DN24914_c0_g1_i1.p1 TRINITY_DN24914_c0_g1~~TRINITY_DN24914_c0_g1_i1.p1  ORF type:complete len:1074 (+),score=278.77 TRINITY_DN24914_c0_g1_i1:158-3379(+)
MPASSALIEAASVLGSGAFEALSLVWMELSMFLVAGIVYVLFLGGSRKQVRSGDGPAGKAAKLAEPVESHDHGDATDVLSLWSEAQASGTTSAIDLVLVVEAFRKTGKSCTDIIQEFRAGIEANAALLSNIEVLPAALLRDDNVELLSSTVSLLEEFKRAPDSSVYAGLMGAMLRRRDYTGIAKAAANVAPENVTPKMRSLLAASAAQRGRLDEALGHIRQLPAPAADGARGVLAPACAAHVLALAAKEQRVPAATEELVRVRARLETRHLDELFAVDGWRRKGGGPSPAARKELLKAAEALQVPKGPVIYQATATALAQEADTIGFRQLMQELQTEVTPKSEQESPAVQITEGLALALLEAAKACKCGDLITKILDMHKTACAGAAGARVLTAVCGALLACDRLNPACDFYERDMVPRNITLDAGLTSSLMKAAAQGGRSGLAQRLSDHAGSLRSSSGGGTSFGSSNADLQRQATMIKAHARERDLKGARAVFEQARGSGAALTPLLYNAMLDALVQCGETGAALRHFEEMKQNSLVDVVSYNTILKSHLAEGRTEEARSLVKEMSARGLQANRVTYNELLHAKVMAKDRRGVWTLIDEMHAAGVQANSVTCSILLKSLTTQSSTEEVKRVTSLIEEVDENIDEVLFSSVIEACIRIRQLNLLSDLMRRYKGKKTFANLSAPTYGSMIKAYGQAGDVVRVKELWQEMDERGVKPTSITLGCMTESLVANNCADDALQLIHEQMQSEERRGSINTVIYSTVLKGFATAKRMDKVFAVYKEMRDHDIPCNTITYNTLLDACAKSCSMNRASGLLVDMKQSAVEPDIITYSTIVKGYCLEGDVDRAFDVLEEMKSDDKFQPDEIMYNSILDGCAKQHRVEQALSVLEEMRNAGIGPSNYTLSILVKALGHARRLGQAFRMVEDLSKQNGFRPNVQVYTCLVQACILNRRLDKALALHDTMVADSGCRVDDKFYAVLARGCVQMHQPLKALEVVRAAYRLPGHSLSEPANTRAPAVGVEHRALEEVASKLNGSGPEEQQAWQQLTSELAQRGVYVRDGGNGRSNGGRGRGQNGSRR